MPVPTGRPVAGQPVGLRPSHLIQSPDGFFYLTYGNVAGPNNVTDGAVWKYNPKDGSWKNISPEKPAGAERLGWGYGAVSVDLKHPSTVVVTTIDRWDLHDEVFRSTDGGATWKGILVTNGRLDYSLAPYTGQGHTPHWMGSRRRQSEQSRPGSFRHRLRHLGFHQRHRGGFRRNSHLGFSRQGFGRNRAAGVGQPADGRAFDQRRGRY